MFTFNATAVGLAVLCMGCIDLSHPPIGANSTAANSTPGKAYGCRSWAEARQIPDNDRRGILLGPLFTQTDSGHLGQVVLRLDLRHQATEDLAVRLAYDADGDGTPEIQVPVEFFRARPDAQGQELHACPESLNGSYFFRDGAGGEPFFAALRALPEGRAFYLAVADTLAGETGTVLGWSVQLDQHARPQKLALR
jgi:hypothetical protein